MTNRDTADEEKAAEPNISVNLPTVSFKDVRSVQWRTFQKMGRSGDFFFKFQSV